MFCCLFTDEVKSVNLVFLPGNNIPLLCQAHSNLAKVYWRHSGQFLRPDDKFYFSQWGLLIVNAAKSDAGLYICDSVEKTTGRIYNRTEVIYHLQLPPVHPTPPTTNTKGSKKKEVSISSINNPMANQQNVTVTILIVAVILLSVACASLAVALIWMCRRGRYHRSFEVAQSTHPQNKFSKKSFQGLHSVRLLNIAVHHTVGRDKLTLNETKN